MPPNNSIINNTTGAKPRARTKKTHTTLPMVIDPALLPQVGQLLDRILGILPRLLHQLLHPSLHQIYKLLPANTFWPSPRRVQTPATVYFIRENGRPIDCVVWIQQNVQLLWNNGAFGKGILSRSNPTWLLRQIRRSTDRIDDGSTVVFPEDRTRQRRQLRPFARDPGVSVDDQSDPDPEIEPVQLSPCETLFLHQTQVLVPIDSVTKLAVPFTDLWTAFAATDEHLGIKYAAYFYYRARGWAVRSGIKFGSDFLLYNGGPEFSHSVYSVVVRQRHQEVGGEDELQGLKDTWQYLFALNRVATQAKKILVVCYVDPPVDESKITDPSQYTVEELVVTRFNPNAKKE
ncbi:tRNA splicing endonuclease subunit sen2 [Coemansia sp. RSA 486]|nr:tRNA splicing endonuclease subunit sen2 [Coemansia sp. RSA 486]